MAPKPNSSHSPFGWMGIVRLGCVQAAIGSVVVLTTSTLNRVMVVELALPAVLPGLLVAIHYFIQITRPKFGHSSDLGGRRTPWIVGGMAVLASGGAMAALATALMATSTWAGIGLAVVAFLCIGAGVGACGTSMLVLLAARVEPTRRAAAATITWTMMIASFAITAGVVGGLLNPFSYSRLVIITSLVSILAFAVTVAATWRLELPNPLQAKTPATEQAKALDDTPVPQALTQQSLAPGFMAALRDVLHEPHTRRFTLFVFISMLAYSAQDLVLEPFAGAVFGLTPGQSTQLGGLQHSGVLAGMLLVALIGTRRGDGRIGILRACLFAGCLGSAGLLACLAAAGLSGPPWPLYPNVFALGFANGVFAIAAIGAMMGLVSEGAARRDGMRMGIWGAAQAIAFGLGGIVGTLSVDISRWLLDSQSLAYGVVFFAQAAMFTYAARLAMTLKPPTTAKVQSVETSPSLSGIRTAHET